MRRTLLSLLFTSLSTMEIFAAPELRYRVSFPEPHTHYAEVTLEISGFKEQVLDVRMPSWTPGSYLLREFAKSVEQVYAESEGKKVSYRRTDKNTWQFPVKGLKSLTVRYKVYAFEWSVRTSFIDADMAFLHQTSVFMMVEQLKHIPGTLEVLLPSAWKQMNVALPQTASGVFSFAHYDDLADAPLIAGNYETADFKVQGVLHTVAVVGQGNQDMDVFVRDLKAICDTTTGIFGQHPCKNYLFIVLNTEAGGGGLEHANSCTVMMPRWQWNNPTRYKQFLGLCGHEFLHLWNVKRIRPEALGPFDYSRENHTDMLWVAEGITSYYDELILRRAGYYTREAYLEKVAAAINDLEQRPGRLYQTLAESSHDAWIREYRPNENSKNTTISYYGKGQVLAFLLDASIVSRTSGARNLDDVMKALWQQFLKRPERGFSNDEFYATLDAIGGAGLGAEFRRLVESTETPDYAGILAKAGITAQNPGKPEITLGISTAIENGRLMVKYVERDLPAWKGGLSVNDELVAVDGRRIGSNLEEVNRLLISGTPVQVLVSRAGLMRTLTITPEEVKRAAWTLETQSDRAMQRMLQMLLD
ncbi:MAG: PDZ domain-containing protein [Bacteroidetes bacterium]|nr:PDZ domain-containing protein [Bacteroidota bacterium]